MFKFGAALAMLLASSAASAEWREASSKNFLVYSEGSEKMLRDAATKLEKYDFVLRTISNVKPASKPNKLKIYLMDDVSEVAATMPFGGSGVGGYYTTSARGPFAVGVNGVISGAGGMTGRDVLFHEYAHHFMNQNFPAAYPSWYSEGFAEYYGSTKILANDVVEVGHPQANRYRSFEGNEWLPLDKLLTARSYADVRGDLHLLYAEGWLLVHYAANNPERHKQLQAYLRSINAGRSYKDAMESAFGPGAKTLDNELRNYATRGRIMLIRLPFKPIDAGPIALRTLRPAEQALLETDIMLQAGIPVAKAQRLAEQVRTHAAAHPGDPYAAAMLVEAERTAGNMAAARVATDAWLALEPNSTVAQMHRADLELERLRSAKSTDQAAYEAARAALLKAHKSSPRDPRILMSYYNSFAGGKEPPPPGAQNALVRAFELVPQDGDIRYLLAADFERRGMIDDAIKTISPAAYELHGTEAKTEKEKKKEALSERKYKLASVEKRETAREMLTRLEGKRAAGEPAKTSAKQ